MKKGNPVVFNGKKYLFVSSNKYDKAKLQEIGTKGIENQISVDLNHVYNDLDGNKPAKRSSTRT